MLLTIIYLAFISLGLPDSLLGSAWPIIYKEFDVPVSLAGVVSIVISLGTVISCLMGDRMTRKLGTGKITAISVAMTAVALFGFSISNSFWMLCLWAIPYGLGAGSVDVSLNNYVANHYASRHMSWLHCMWGIGAATGPYIMGAVLSGGKAWNMGYRIVSWIQIALTIILFISLALWEKEQKTESVEKPKKALRLSQIVRIPGTIQVMITFFCYCAVEQTAGLWASSYLVMKDGLGVEKAAGYASLFYIGITAGRALSGFLTIRFSDKQMVRIGQAVILLGIAVMLLPLGSTVTMVGLVLVGLGCAPIYPCLIHSTPAHFGAEHSQAIIGVQMASSYLGICVMPPLFGILANHISASLMPVFLFLILSVMVVMYSRLVKNTCQ